VCVWLFVVRCVAMADGLITQVRKEDVQARQPARKQGFLSKLWCCFSSSGNQQQQHTASGSNTTVNTSPEPHPVPSSSGGEEPLLPPLRPEDYGKKCLVLDLDETLVHSSFKPIPNADFQIPVEIDDQVHQVYVSKRPGVDQFMKRMGELYEVVVFTASLSKYADPVLDLLDPEHVVRYRLFREGCTQHKGNYVKDMSRLGRPLKSAIIIDNSPASYMFHPENAIPIDSWFDDMNDTELLDLIPFLEDLTKVDDVCAVLDQHRG